jgi:hypothetical protein
MMRRGLVWVALAGTLFACWWVGNEEPVELAGPPDKAITSRKPSPVKATVTLAQAMPGLTTEPSAVTEPAAPDEPPVFIPRTAPDEDAGVNLFAALEMPSADIAVAEIPAAINPYTYAGRLQEAGRWTIFLTDGQQQYVLHEGDYFAEGWQVALLDQQKVVLRHAAERFEIRLDNGVVF